MFYRKKPVVIEAWRITQDALAEIATMPEWLRVELQEGGRVWFFSRPPTTAVFVSITTLEGTMHGNIGDWIIKGVKNELYPCKNDIFEATYDGPFESDPNV